MLDPISEQGPARPSLLPGWRPRLRAFLVGLALIPFNAWWILQCETLRFSKYPTALSLLFNAVVLLLAWLALNALVRWRWPGQALRRSELLLV